MQAQALHTFPLNTITLLGLTVLLLPLLASALIAAGAKFFGKKSHVLALSASIPALLLSMFILTQVWNSTSAQSDIRWISIGTISIHTGILIDATSALMLVLVSFIATLVQVFSVYYMKGDEGYARYFAYLSLFVSAMFGLVLADNLLWLYICWELVGFCSYLLIGFWKERDAASQASKKAFLMNRVGDLGFLVGIFILFSQFSTFDLSVLGASSQAILRGDASALSHIAASDVYWLHAAGFCLLLGVLAKSAQFPLHTWLPDAMEGPTPVSSLIHAATMVVAGVYLLIRMSPVFSPEVLTTIAFTGAFTAFMAATIATVQQDIKKVLAYSTISQLGYMVMAVGVGSTAAAFIHLLTHAFFKCLLFLASGVIIHELKHYFEQEGIHKDPQDMRNMGGLRKKLPLTFYTYSIAAAALAGLPFFTGFLSKDVILTQSLHWSAIQGEPLAYLVPVFGFATVLLTAFYITRQYLLVFFKKSDFTFPVFKESVLVKIPLVLLAACSLFPLFSLHPFSLENSALAEGLNLDIKHLSLVPLGSVILLMAGAGWAYVIYVKGLISPLSSGSILRQFLYKGWYIDELYQVLFIRPVVAVSGWMKKFDTKVIDGFVNFLPGLIRRLAAFISWFDRVVIDGVVNGLARLAGLAGDMIRLVQTGSIQGYIGLAVFGLIILYVMTWII